MCKTLIRKRFYGVLMATNATTDTGLTPDDVREQARQFREKHVDAAGPSLLAAALTPRSRVQIIDVLLGAPGERLSAAEICDAAGIDRGTFTRQERPLIDLGVMEHAGRVGNARTYRLNRAHPLAQLLGMADHVLRFGTTADLLDERFIGTPGSDYAPGEHPEDPR